MTSNGLEKVAAPQVATELVQKDSHRVSVVAAIGAVCLCVYLWKCVMCVCLWECPSVPKCTRMNKKGGDLLPLPRGRSHIRPFLIVNVFDTRDRSKVKGQTTDCFFGKVAYAPHGEPRDLREL